MKAGNTLLPGEEFLQNGLRLVYQHDGNLVIYDAVQAVWTAGVSNASPGFATLQGDGNFVVYDSLGQWYWASDSFGNQPVLALTASGPEITAHATIWSDVYSAPVVPIEPTDPPPIPPPPTIKLTRLRVEDNKRWFRNDDGRFDYREITAFSLLSRLLTDETDYVRGYLRTVRAYGFTVVRVILTLDGPYWTNSPAGRSFRCAPDMPRYWEKLDLLVALCAEEGVYLRAVFVGAVEPFGGTWHPDRRDVWNGSVRSKGEQFMVDVALRIGVHAHVIGELANEPGQIGMRDSFEELVAVGRRCKAIAPDMILGLGAVDGPNDQDTRLCVKPADYVDAHIHRLIGVQGFEWVKRTGEYALIDQDNVSQKMPFISGEPINFGEWRLDHGRESDVERSPTVAFAYAAVSRSRQYSTNFHYDGGLWTTLPKPETEACIRAYMLALDTFPMMTGTKWRNHWSPAQGNYWNPRPWPPTDDLAEVERFVSEGRGGWRAYGCEDASVVFPEPEGWDYTKAVAVPPVSRLARITDGAFAVGIYRKG